MFVFNKARILSLLKKKKAPKIPNNPCPDSLNIAKKRQNRAGKKSKEKRRAKSRQRRVRSKEKNGRKKKAEKSGDTPM